jgi:hypothetical protein
MPATVKAVLVLLHYLQGYGIERDNHRKAAEMQRLCGEVLKGIRASRPRYK